MIFIPYVLRSHAILQRDVSTTFWGMAAAQSRVTLTYEQHHLETTAGTNGYFQFELAPHAAGDPVTFEVTSGTERAVSRDVLFGDVWLLAGQSNMQLWLQRLAARYPHEVDRAKDANIHFFMVPQRYDFKQADDDLAAGEWQTAVGKNIEMLSGIGYFYAQLQRRETHVPIGLISTAIGGTPVRSWVSQPTLAAIGELPLDFEKLADQQFLDDYVADNNRYQQSYEKLCAQSDQGVLGHWQRVETDDTQWTKLALDGETWPEDYRQPGVIWIRKHLQTPAAMVGQPAEFRLGTFVDADETYLNGQKIGETGYQYPPRNYRVDRLPAELTLTIRLHVFNAPGGPRFGKQHVLIGEQQTVDLDAQGAWLVKRGCWLPPKRESVFPQYQPVGLFNGMIYPLRRLNLKGILWYQGESDAARPTNYGRVFVHLIQEWRRLFRNPALPFLYVQLPNCAIEPNHVWSKVRLAQKAGLALDHTAMVVALGLGEDNDLHPLNKAGVAQQLFDADQMLAQYPNGYSNGPLATAAALDNHQIRLQFETFGHQLVASPGKFELCQNGQLITLPDFQVIGNTVAVRLPEGLNVVPGSQIRYAYANAPVTFLRNDADQPASPFVLEVENHFYQESILTNL
ncbi:sialate O-acetylesterase [Levilactobacillus zymae]|uniref:sialate O-acetylesterase n=1 Tax=Levilactobacillus zymae TaxID=267363 RepID=UPI0028B43888|nr:sialate O-acetylesterase [Levilactobacillus zymae]MDT6981444.1 sialate O-acetylesterase [Levilactobacillus zymae]